MGAFSTGVQAGQQTAANPFGVILSRVREFEARKLKETETEKSESNELKQALLLLGKKHEFDIKLKQEEADIDIEKGEPIAQAMKRFGLGGQPTAPTPTAPTAAPTSPITKVPDQGQAVLQATGLQPRGTVRTTSKGKEFFFPEDIKEEKTRLQTEALRREATPEGRAKLFKEEAQAKSEIKKATDKVVAETKVTLGILVSRNNLETVSGLASDLASVYVDAFKEGGAGGAIQSGIARAATKVGDLPGFLGGGRIGSRFPASGAFAGKRMEFILKMMPMLTQQGLKAEGSVRIITGVLDALGKTIPELGTAPITAKRQLKESMLSFFRFARGAEILGITFDQVFSNQDPNNISEDQLTSWVASVNSASSRLKIEDAELKSFEGLVDVSMSRFDEVIESGKTGEKDRQNKLREEAERRGLL